MLMWSPKSQRKKQNYIVALSIESSEVSCILIREWDIKTGQCIGLLIGHCQWIKTVSQSSMYLVSGGWDECIKIWNKENGKCNYTIQLNMGPVCNLQCDQNKIMAICREEGFQHQLTMVDFGRNFAGWWGESQYRLSLSQEHPVK